MRIPITLPQSGFSDGGLRIVAWLVAPGDQVERGQVIAEVETEKATVEMEALDAGTVAELVAELGAELPAGTVIGWLEGPD